MKIMMIRHQNIARRSGRTLPFVLLLFAGCDPGYRYRPSAWHEAGNGQWSSDVVENVTITTSGIAGLVGSDYIFPEFEIVNRTDQALVLENAVLAIDGTTLTGNLPHEDALEFRTVGPSESKRLAVHWSLPEPAVEMLGKRPVLVLDFHLGDELRTVEIIYDRVVP